MTRLGSTRYLSAFPGNQTFFPLAVVNLSPMELSSYSSMGWKKGHAVQLLPLSQATGRVLEVYRDVQQVFGVPHISSFFQFLGTQPRFLDRYWSAVRPLANTEAFFTCAQRLRVHAYARVHDELEIPDLKVELNKQRFSPGACDELKDCINFFCHAVPMSLLLSATLSKAFEGPAGSADVPRNPPPTPKPHRRIVMVEEDSTGPAVKAIFADIRQTTGADVVHTVYRAFGRWPDFLQSYWTLTKPIVVSDHFRRSESAMYEEALQITAQLPGPMQFTAADLAALGMNETESFALIGVTDMFVHSLAAALLNVGVARIAMDGGCLCKAAPQTNAEVPLT